MKQSIKQILKKHYDNDVACEELCRTFEAYFNDSIIAIEKNLLVTALRGKVGSKEIREEFENHGYTCN